MWLLTMVLVDRNRYIGVNRLGTIPYMTDRDNPTLGMTESCAAPMYLAGTLPSNQYLKFQSKEPCLAHISVECRREIRLT